MYYYKFYLFLLFFSTSIFSSDLLDSGSWFSEEEKFRNGFSYQTIYFKKNFSKNRFLLGRVSYNKERLWEEIRIKGTVQFLKDNQYELTGEICSVYSAKKLGDRWILLRSVDCDHHKLNLTKNENSFIIDDIFESQKQISFSRPESKKQNLIFAKIIHKEEEVFAWSLEIRGVRKNSKSNFLNQNIILEEIVDSTAKIKPNNFLNKSDIIQIENSTQSLFD